jgi:hypothetical protein
MIYLESHWISHQRKVSGLTLHLPKMEPTKALTLLSAINLRHLTGRAQLQTLLNHLGHCQSYSKTLELVTSIYTSSSERPGLPPQKIQKEGNVVTHFCWDNFNLKEETQTGQMQFKVQQTTVPKTKARSVTYRKGKM